MQVARTAGCYQLVDGDSHLPEGFSPSPVILLDSIPAHSDESATIMFAWVLPPDSVARPATTLAVWRIDPTNVNTIHLWLSNGFERSALALRRTADTLDGNVRRIADFPRVFFSHRARAIRVRCPQ
jgi:hypothetical protein